MNFTKVTLGCTLNRTFDIYPFFDGIYSKYRFQYISGVEVHSN